MKNRIITLNFIKASWGASKIGIWIALHIFYFSTLEDTSISRFGSGLSFIMVVYLLVHYLNRSIYSLVELNNIRKAVQEQQTYTPLTLRERIFHNAVLAPWIVTVVYVVFSTDLLSMHYVLGFSLLVVQFFVGNVSHYRFSQVFYPYYQKAHQP